MNGHRIRIVRTGAAMLAAALLAPAATLAQEQVGTAHALDHNLRLGSGGYNTPGTGAGIGGGGRVAAGGPAFQETIYRGRHAQADYYNAFYAQRRYDPGRANAFRPNVRRFENGDAGFAAGTSRFDGGYDQGYEAGLADAAAVAALPEPAEHQMEEISYALGYFMGEDMRQSLGDDNVEADTDSVISGFRDGLFDNTPRISPTTIEDMLANLEGQVESSLVEGLGERNPEFRALSEHNLAASRAFQEQFGKRPGVVTLPDGLQYQVLVAAEGPKPGPDDDVVVNYKVILLDGSVLSEGADAEVRVSSVVKGGAEALQMMSPGAKWLIAIPPELAHGAAGKYPQVGPNATLFCEVELVSIKGAG